MHLQASRADEPLPSQLPAPRGEPVFWAVWGALLVLGVVLRLYLGLSERVGYGALGYDYLLYERLATGSQGLAW